MSRKVCLSLSSFVAMTRRANQRSTPPVFFETSATILAATASIS
jgi:hypothetical protein